MGKTTLTFLKEIYQKGKHFMASMVLKGKITQSLYLHFFIFFISELEKVCLSKRRKVKPTQNK